MVRARGVSEPACCTRWADTADPTRSRPQSRFRSASAPRLGITSIRAAHRDSSTSRSNTGSGSPRISPPGYPTPNTYRIRNSSSSTRSRPVAQRRAVSTLPRSSFVARRHRRTRGSARPAGVPGPRSPASARLRGLPHRRMTRDAPPSIGNLCQPGHGRRVVY
jgi:hypothetical protein